MHAYAGVPSVHSGTVLCHKSDCKPCKAAFETTAFHWALHTCLCTLMLGGANTRHSGISETRARAGQTRPARPTLATTRPWPSASARRSSRCSMRAALRTTWTPCSMVRTTLHPIYAGGSENHVDAVFYGAHSIHCVHGVVSAKGFPMSRAIRRVLLARYTAVCVGREIHDPKTQRMICCGCRALWRQQLLSQRTVSQGSFDSFWAAQAMSTSTCGHALCTTSRCALRLLSKLVLPPQHASLYSSVIL